MSLIRRILGRSRPDSWYIERHLLTPFEQSIFSA
jgi:hypothetical protein